MSLAQTLIAARDFLLKRREDSDNSTDSSLVHQQVRHERCLNSWLELCRPTRVGPNLVK